MIPVMVVPVLTRYPLLYDMLETVDVPVDRLVIIDNGGAAYGQIIGGIASQWARHVHVLNMPSNLGVAASWNLGMKATPFAPWWLVCNFDVRWPSGVLQQFASQSNPGAVVVSGETAQWCAFTIGEQVVQQVGLFDEGIHPAYYEDLDYERRCAAHGVPVIRSGLLVGHSNSSTLASGYAEKNSATFGVNAARARSRADEGDLSNGDWSLATRRALSWD